MREFVVAAVQLAPQPGPLTAESVKANLTHAVTMVDRCIDQTSAELVILPETASTGFSPGIGPEALWDLVSAVPGPVTEPLQEAARRHRTHLVWCTYERGETRGVVHNAAVFLGPTGDVLGVYRKTHLYCGEHLEFDGWTTPGDAVCVVETPMARLGAVICFDGDYPELSRVQAVRGAEVIVRPSALVRSADIWELTTRARAYDNHVWVVGANAVGADPGGLWYFGNSLVVSPIGHVEARGNTQEGWVSARLHPDAMRAMSPGSSQPQRFDHLADRNLDLYRRYVDDLTGPAATSFPHPSFRTAG